MPFRDLSIGQKLQRVCLLSGLAALVPAAVAFALYDVYTTRDLLVRRIETDASIVGFNCIAPLVFNDAEAATSTLGALKAEAPIVGAGVYTRSGELFASYSREPGIAPI